MIGYALVETATGKVKSFMSWGENEITEDYPIEEGHHVLKLEDDLFFQTTDRFLQVTGMRVKNPNALVYEELVEEEAERNFAFEQEVTELKNYLDSTDFYFIRSLDSGKAIPADVKEKRKQVRARLTELGL